MTDFTQLFLYIPGVVIFLIGSNAIRVQRAKNRLGACVNGSVVSCNHVVKKDRQGREIYNYHNVVVQFIDPKTLRDERFVLKTSSEYAEGQQVTLFRRGGKQEPVLVPQEDESLFGPWTTAIGGALMILLALMSNQGKELTATFILVLILAGAGASLISTYLSLKKRNLQEIDAEITEVYTRQISKGTKIIKGDKFTYYPTVTYTLNGQKNFRRCNINSSGEKTFKVGETMKLYYDPKTHQVIEQHAKTSVLVWGVILLGVGLLAGVSSLAVIIPMLAA